MKWIPLNRILQEHDPLCDFREAVGAREVLHGKMSRAAVR